MTVADTLIVFASIIVNDTVSATVADHGYDCDYKCAYGYGNQVQTVGPQVQSVRAPIGA